jgi:hypothetical protein
MRVAASSLALMLSKHLIGFTLEGEGVFSHLRAAGSFPGRVRTRARGGPPPPPAARRHPDSYRHLAATCKPHTHTRPIGSCAACNPHTCVVLLIGRISMLSRWRYRRPVARGGRDLICVARTGSGKTAGFLFPLINMIGEQTILSKRPAKGLRHSLPTADPLLGVEAQGTAPCGAAPLNCNHNSNN